MSLQIILGIIVLATVTGCVVWVMLIRMYRRQPRSREQLDAMRNSSRAGRGPYAGAPNDSYLPFAAGVLAGDTDDGDGGAPE